MRRRGERGQAGGMEVLPFGLLIFVAGTLLLVNVWGVVDTKFATDAAAREAARWLVERAEANTSSADLLGGAEEVARATMADHGRDGPVRVDIGPPGAALERCQRIRVTVTVDVPAIRVPFIGGFGDDLDVRASHAEIVDPLRSGVAGTAGCIG